MKLSNLLPKGFFREVPKEEQAITKIEESLGTTIEEAKADFMDSIREQDERNEYLTHRIEIDCNEAAARELIPLIKELYRLGAIGSSRDIKIENYEGKDTFGFDGDGPSKIGGLRMNGKTIIPKQYSK